MCNIKSILSAAALVILLGIGGAAQADIVPADLVAYWKLDGNLLDSAGSNHGSIQDVDGGGDNTSFATDFDGTPNGAIDVRGTTDRVQTTLNTPTGPKSMSFFFASFRETWSIFASSGGNDGTGNFNHNFTVAGHRHQLGLNNGLSIVIGKGGSRHLLPSVAFEPPATDVAADGTYHHVVLTDDGAGNFIAYYRSPSDSFHSVYTGTYQGTSGVNGIFHIGGQEFSGMDSDSFVDDVAVFNRMLTQEEAESIYAAGSVARLLDTTSAFDPTPVDGEDDVLRDVTLTWKPGEFAVKGVGA